MAAGPLLPDRSLPRGAFVWCRFPQREAHRDPGPPDHLHLVYVHDTASNKAVCVYTTSVMWPSDKPLPFGVIAVPWNKAAGMRQKTFVLDARRIGIFPLTTTWFPDLDKPDRGILHVAPEAFRRTVGEAAREVARRKELIQWFGPGAPENTESSKPKI